MIFCCWNQNSESKCGSSLNSQVCCCNVCISYCILQTSSHYSTPSLLLLPSLSLTLQLRIMCVSVRRAMPIIQFQIINTPSVLFNPPRVNPLINHFFLSLLCCIVWNKGELSRRHVSLLFRSKLDVSLYARSSING
jgi:hypothetical protein